MNLIPMNILKSKTQYLLACLFLIVSFSTPLKAGNDFPADITKLLKDIESFDAMEEEITERIRSVVTIVEPRYDSRVKSYLRTYLELSPDNTAAMLGRMQLYFPMFERLLEQNNMPKELRYLAIVESALRPTAVSRVGAVGLWQFMKPTAREMGLLVTRDVDERRDPEKSTQAALEYLARLYSRFGDWALAMAAYNAGPGRVSYAIRRSGSKDFRQVMRYLPRETRSYVPGFIAAGYLVNFYEQHQLEPVHPGLELLDTDFVRVHKGISFAELNQITGVPMVMIKMLNPKFIRNYIPATVIGYDVYLPRYAIPSLHAHLNIPDSEVGEEAQTAFVEMNPGMGLRFEERMVEHWYEVRSGDNLYKIAQRHQCSVDDLMKWNRLRSTKLAIGQDLRIMWMEKILVSPPARPHFVTPPLELQIREIQYTGSNGDPVPEQPVYSVNTRGIRGKHLRIGRRQSAISMLQESGYPMTVSKELVTQLRTGSVVHLD